MSNVDTNKSNAAASAPQGQLGLSNMAVAFGVSAAVAIIFNTLLAWVKDSVPALNTAMAQLTGHHWITHGLAVIAVFFLVGIFLAVRTGNAVGGEFKPILVLFASVVLGCAGLFGWFYFV